MPRTVLRIALRLATALLIAYLGVWMVAALADALGVRWPDIPTRAPNEGISPALLTFAALGLAVASLGFFLWEQIWNRRQPGRNTPPALYLGIMSVLMLQLGLLFAAESVYDFLFKTFK